MLPYRSNIPKIAEFVFESVDDTYPRRVSEVRDRGGHAVVGGRNYGQGSSRKHAALAPRYLGLRVVVAVGYARIHHQNLVSFGILPLEFVDPADYESVDPGRELRLRNLGEALRAGDPLVIENLTTGADIEVRHRMSQRQTEAVVGGGFINVMREQLGQR